MQDSSELQSSYVWGQNSFPFLEARNKIFKSSFFGCFYKGLNLLAQSYTGSPDTEQVDGKAKTSYQAVSNTVKKINCFVF